MTPAPRAPRARGRRRLVIAIAALIAVAGIDAFALEEARSAAGSSDIFIIGVLVLGAGVLLYTLGVVVERLPWTRWQELRRRRGAQSQLEFIRNHVIVCGYGRGGRVVVEELHRRQIPCVVVDLQLAALEEARKRGEITVAGDAATDPVLAAAGIDRARALVAAVDSDERNAYIVLTARSLSAGLYIIAHGSNSDAAVKLRRAGAQRIVSR